ncbi:TonB-dependent receptor [Dyadobacter flavalbus]|uniref:TonB-dependent receptor n=2 Tax=Dyadobacter flavalbus TaxID=2579942 RepID=A0A5M8QL49_9BACT|nr:TonB-dependent receptor [Dyadobacter flavalbus]
MFKSACMTVSLILVSWLMAFSQSQNISGTVSDEKGEGLPGVGIVVKGTTIGTTTDVEGKFTLGLPENATTLVLSSVGMKSMEVPVDGKTVFAITMLSDERALNEVVVVGYGTTRKSDITGAVASVKAEQITQIATANPLQAIQGRVAGVNITSQSGEPGSGVRVRIRGVGTINNSDPLYVVDGFQTNDISFLAPGDIASMEILKDASATAIYGSRGANGVILVTTKRGKSGAPKISFDAYAGVQKAWNKVDLLNASQYATLRLESYANDGTVLPTDGTLYQTLNGFKQSGEKGTNWQDEVMQTGVMQNYSLNIMGGNEKHRYSLTGTYFDQQGIVKNTPMKKLFLRFNNDFYVTKWLNAGISAAYASTDRTPYFGDQYGGVLTSALSVSSLAKAWDPATNFWGKRPVPEGGAYNPARIVSEYKNNKAYQTLVNSNFFLDAKISKDLSFRTQFGMNWLTTHDKRYLPQYYLANDDQRQHSSLREGRGETLGWVWTNYLTYNKTFGKHNITAMAGIESQRSTFSDMRLTVLDVPNDKSQWYLSATKSTDYLLETGQSDESIQSYFGRVNYNFDERLLLTATLRRDGSSRFLPNNRWGTFPSFALGYNLAEESFIKSIPAISQLKLRAGWGQVGNQNSAANYGYVTTVSGNNMYVFGDNAVQGFAPTTASNPDLKWETTTSTNFGIDAGFFSNRLSLTADYFIKNTSDMIVRVPIPVFAGVGPPYVNAGSMSNKGVELALNYRSSVKDFTYDIGVNASKILNRVTDLGGGEPIAGGDVNGLGQTTRTEVGREIAVFYGLKTDGIFRTQADLDAYTKEGTPIQPNAKPGDVKFVDLNNDGVIDNKDRTYLGSATPSFSFGFNTSLGYKGFDLSFFLQGVTGVELVNGLGHWMNNANGMFNSVASRMDRWTPENTNTDQPRMTQLNPNNNDQFSDRFVSNGNYVRFRNLTLGYTLPKTVLEKARISNLRIYVAADNLFTFTKYKGMDPEIGEFNNNPLNFGVDMGAYPQPRVGRIGLSVNF